MTDGGTWTINSKPSCLPTVSSWMLPNGGLMRARMRVCGCVVVLGWWSLNLDLLGGFKRETITQAVSHKIQFVRLLVVDTLVHDASLNTSLK